MKTILVPTDFSIAARNAARYAMHVAQAIRANVMLCNAILIPAESPMAGAIVWPLEDYDSLQKSAERELHALANKLKETERETNPSGHFHPDIFINSSIGEVSDVIRNIFSDYKGSMTIMGMSGAGTISRIFLGSNSKRMVECATFPLLLIPSSCSFTGLTKIAFATDLSDSDIEILHSITSFAKYFNAEILVVHITDAANQKEASKKKIEKFLCEVSNKANYPKVYYRHITSEGVNSGLTWLCDHGQIDMLAMVHRDHSIFHDLFQGSHTQKMARRADIPLLVYPANCHTIF
ncbi:MAG: universal stress protein [Mucilaginibacter sp.]|uniref:universal stress protein n=1 Tax=Mucilaginibacter sp. TaxID=1882438 RepID=UPI0031B39C3B